MQQTPPQNDSHQAQPPRVDLDAVRAVIEPVVAAHGVELYDLEWKGGVLRVFIERSRGPATSSQGPVSESGVTLDDCVNVSRDLSTALDVADLIPCAYSLEVSSPGLDRPLKRPIDFRRSVGKLAKCKLIAPASDGQMVLRGTILAADDHAVRMEVDGKEHEVPLANVREAKLVVQLGAAKPRTNKKTKGARSK